MLVIVIGSRLETMLPSIITIIVIIINILLPHHILKNNMTNCVGRTGITILH